MLKDILTLENREAFEPEQLLIAGIINSAFDECDLRYFNSPVFEWHCLLIGVDADIIRERGEAHVAENSNVV